MCIMKVKHPSGGTPSGKKTYLIALLLFGPGHQKCSYGDHDINEVLESEIGGHVFSDETSDDVFE